MSTSRAGISQIRVGYYCGVKTFFEYINVESESAFNKKRSRDWFRQRYHYTVEQAGWNEDVPPTNAELLTVSNELRWPVTIRVWINRPMPEIMGYEFANV